MTPVALPSKPAEEPLVRVVMWLVVLLVSFFWMYGSWRDAFRPKEGYYWDFSQEWLSARNFWTGKPIYLSQRDTLVVHTGHTTVREGDMLPWNAHPPASVLLGLPFGALPFERLSYRDAHLLWNLTMTVCFLWALVIALRLRARPIELGGILMIATLLLLCAPLLTQLFQGQLNGIIVLLAVLAWAADRREQYFLAGLLIGLAAGIKIVPAFLMLYWLMQRRWRALLGGAVGFLLINGTAAALFGIDAFRTYIEVVVPSVSGYRSSWDNVSLSGLWYKLFFPREVERVQALVYAPWLAIALSMLSQAAVAALVAWKCFVAKTRPQRDHALGLTVIGMLLVSPITWSHYFLILMLPLCVSSGKPTSSVGQWFYWISLTLLWIPIPWTAVPSMGIEIAKVWNVDRRSLPQATPRQVLLGLAVQTYALCVFFAIYYRTFPSASAVGSENRSPSVSAPSQADTGR